jgi:hypothetical protein
MNGELAQLIALATHGTVWLQDGGHEPLNLESTNSAFQFTRRVTFEPYGGVDTWLGTLAVRGVDRIWLMTHPALHSPVPDDSSTWHRDVTWANAIGNVAGLHVGGKEMWRGTSVAAGQGGSERRIWDTVFRPAKYATTPSTPALSEAEARLNRALDQAVAFARQHGHQPFDQILSRAKALGTADEPAAAYHPDLFPLRRYSPGSRRLAAMAQASWVFGGMGSWNDIGFPEEAVEREFQRVSRELFAATMVALTSATNAKLFKS